MARIRTIKPELFTDPDLATVSIGARWLFAGLFTEVDDKGRIIDSPKRIAGAIFPHDEKITASKVKAWLDELADIDCIRRYDAGSHHLIWLPHFTDHQRISKPTPSKLPAHPDDKDQDDSEIPPDKPTGNSGETMGENVVGSGSRKLEVEVGSGNLSPPPAGECPPGFDDFWNAYPRRVDKGHARTAWSAALKKAPPELIVEGARRLASDPNLPAEKFIPHPTTWLRGERWDDPPLPSVTQHSPGRRDNGSAALIADIRAGRLGA